MFDYKVGASDYATDLAVRGFDPNGATITDAHGVSANLSLEGDDDLAIEINAAIVTDVTASASTTEATSGEAVTLTLTMSEAVTVNTAGASPTLYLSDGGVATYDAAMSSPSAGKLAFVYEVVADDETPDLQIAQVNLNGATINDAHGHAAELSAATTIATGLEVGPVSAAAPSASHSRAAAAGDIAIARAAYGDDAWSLKGTAASKATVSLFDGSELLGTTTASATGAWTFRTHEDDRAPRAFTASTDASGDGQTSAAVIEGTPSNDTFDVASSDELLSLAGLYGNGGADTIDLTAAATLTDADFAHVHGLHTLELSGASNATLGADAAKAGITTVETGAGATSITGIAGKALKVAVGALSGPLTLAGNAKFTIDGFEPGSANSISGFADKGNGASVNDVIDLSTNAGITSFQGALSSPAAKIAGDSVAYRYDATLDATLIFANAGSTSRAPTDPSLIETELLGGSFRLTAANFNFA